MSRVAGAYSIFVIDVSLNGASALITFELCDNSDRASQRIPYRIENRCARVAFQLSQKDVYAWQLLQSKQAIPYAWDQVRYRGTNSLWAPLVSEALGRLNAAPQRLRHKTYNWVVTAVRAGARYSLRMFYDDFRRSLSI